MKRDKFIRDFKIYNFVMSNIWQFIATSLVGFGIGFLLEKYIGSEKNLYMIFSVIIFISIGVANFFLALYKQFKKIEKREKEDTEPKNYIIYDDDEKESNDQD